MTGDPRDLFDKSLLDDMVRVMIKKAKAGHMGHAREILERDIPAVTASDIAAILDAVTAKAATGNRAARKLKALYVRKRRP
jgi:hypothetical protein